MKFVLLTLGIGTLLISGCAATPKMPGQLVAVDGRRIHIHCTGENANHATIIIEGGMSGVSPFYVRLQQGLEKVTRVCTYDRAGLGWSDPIDVPRDAKRIATELHALLRVANVSPPYILAGHSLGGLIALSYQHEYPNDIAGLVLLDSSYPGQTWNEKSLLKTYRWTQLAAAIGIIHLYNPTREWYAALPDNERAALLYFSNQSSIYKATMGEIKGLNVSGEQTAEIKSVGDIPLLVVTAGKQCNPATKSEEQKARCAEFANKWNLHHEQLTHLSPNGQHITFPDATHFSLVTDEKIAGEVVKLIVGILSTD
jgi:pimeloyl-ACP methyl ester carboxylesterase